jgi:hypothetical protein
MPSAGRPAKEMDAVFGDAFRASVAAQAAAGFPGAADLAAALGIEDADLERALNLATGAAPPASRPSPGLAAAPADDSPAPGGQTAADAIAAVLTRPMEGGELLKLVEGKAREWGRDPWSIRAVTGPLAKLVEDGKVIRTPGPGRVWTFTQSVADVDPSDWAGVG